MKLIVNGTKWMWNEEKRILEKKQQKKKTGQKTKSVNRKYRDGFAKGKDDEKGSRKR